LIITQKLRKSEKKVEVGFLGSFWLDPKRTKKVKIVVCFRPHARAGSHDNQDNAHFS
jgi:hypothetical protein